MNQLIFITTAKTVGGVLIFKPLPFLHRKREILAYIGYFVANLRIDK